MLRLLSVAVAIGIPFIASGQERKPGVITLARGEVLELRHPFLFLQTRLEASEDAKWVPWQKAAWCLSRKWQPLGPWITWFIDHREGDDGKFSRMIGLSTASPHFFRFLSAAHEAGYPRAAYWLAVLVRDGSGAKPDPAVAAKWFLRSAEGGDPKGMYCFAYACQTGAGVERNPQRAVWWFRKAAAAGEPSAMCHLGGHCLRGDSIPKDDVQAREWYRLGAADGEPWSMFNYGNVLINGIGGKADPDAGLRFMERAARKGIDPAATAVAYYLLNGGPGIARDEAKAIEFLLPIARKGNMAAMYVLGQCHDQLPAFQDKAKAVEWYTKAGDAGELNSMMWLVARHLASNEKPKAIGWLTRAAEAGHLPAMNELAKFALAGKDPEKALFWLGKAYVAGDAAAAFRIGYEYDDGGAFLKDPKAAEEWYRKAAAKGHAGARSALGLKGILVDEPANNAVVNADLVIDPTKPAPKVRPVASIGDSGKLPPIQAVTPLPLPQSSKGKTLFLDGKSIDGGMSGSTPSVVPLSPKKLFDPAPKP